MPQQWFFLVIVGIVAGVFSGMFGIGGGVVIVPTLAIFLGLTTTSAIATSLAALLMPVGILAVSAYYRAKLFDVRAAALIAFGLLITSALGALGALALDNINPALLRQVYGLFLLVMGWRFAEPRKFWRAYLLSKDPNATPRELPIAKPQVQGRWYALLIIGLVAGLFSGLFGIGGGAVIVPALVGFLNYDQKRAVGTSLGALLLPVGLPGVLVYYNEGVLNIGAAVMVAVGLLIGAIIGAKVAIGMSSGQVKRLYGIFLFFVAFYFIFRDPLFAVFGIQS